MINDINPKQQSKLTPPGVHAEQTPELNPFAAFMMQPPKTFIDIVIDAFNAEYLRTSLADMLDPQKSETRREERIEVWAIGLYANTNLSTFFSDASMKKITEDIFGFDQVMIRDFVLNFVERVSMMTRIQGPSYLSDELVKIADAVIHAKPDPELSVIPEQVTTSIKLEENIIRKLAPNNVFLFLIYVLLMNFNRVAFFEVLIKAKENANQLRDKKNNQPQ